MAKVFDKFGILSENPLKGGFDERAPYSSSDSEECKKLGKVLLNHDIHCVIRCSMC